MKYKLDEMQEPSHKVLNYLMESPDAKNSLEGIIDWWMLQQDMNRNIVQIRKTVQDLILKGYLLERQGQDGTKYYHVNRQRAPEISALILKIENQE